MTKVIIVILHYIGISLTEQCLKSLDNIEDNNLYILKILVDNNSSEPISKDLEKKYKNLIIIRNAQNLGFAEGNNVGIKIALENEAEYILILNNDTTVDKNFLEELIEKAKQEKVGILAPKIYFAPGYEFYPERYREEEKGKVIWYAGGKIDWKNVYCFHRGVDEVDNGQYNKVETTDFATGCAMLVKKEVFKKIGLFDKKYFLYLEDVDFCLRAKQSGFQIIYVPQAKIWHHNAGSSKVGGDLQDYFITRNRMLFGMKYAPLRTKIALFKESIKILREGRKWQKIAIKDFYLNKFFKGNWDER